jgi:hypothetical protein
MNKQKNPPHIWTDDNMRYCLQKILEDTAPCPICKTSNINLLGCVTSGANGNRYVHIEYKCENEHVFRKVLVDQIHICEAKLFLARFGEDLFAKFSRAFSSAENIMNDVKILHLLWSMDVHPIDSEKLSLTIFWKLISDIYECANSQSRSKTLNQLIDWCNDSILTSSIVKKDYYKRLVSVISNVNDAKHNETYHWVRNMVSGHVGDVNVTKKYTQKIIDKDDLIICTTALDNSTYNNSRTMGATDMIANGLMEKISYMDLIKETADIFKTVPDDINRLFVDVINVMPGAYKHFSTREVVKSFSYVVPDFQKMMAEINNYR